MKILFVKLFFLLILIISCSEEKQMLKNNTVYNIWSTIHISFDNDVNDYSGLEINYNLIKLFPEEYKQIIAYYFIKAGYITQEIDIQIAESLGKFNTFEEAYNDLMNKMEYKNILGRNNDYISTLYIIRNENKIFFFIQGGKYDFDFGDVDVFKIDKNGKLNYIGYYEEIKFNPNYDKIISIVYE